MNLYGFDPMLTRFSLSFFRNADGTYPDDWWPIAYLMENMHIDNWGLWRD